MKILTKLVPTCIFDFELRQVVKGNNFSFNDMTFRAKVVDIYDGDTLTLIFRYCGKLQQHKCRMLGYDSPEMKPLLSMKNRKLEISKAKEARQALLKWVKSCNWIVYIHCHEFDKYGRILIDLYVPYQPKFFGLFHKKLLINQWMIDENYGYPYDGGKKRKK